MSSWVNAVVGGALIGSAAAMLLVLNGRIAGITGITAGMFTMKPQESFWRVAFIVGLVLGGLVMARVMPSAFGVPVLRAAPLIIVAGLLVGVGTRMANGCTSGHGVCGIARLSPRSLTATATFMAAGAATVFVVRHLLTAGA